MAEPAGPADETIKVVCRVRPLNSTEEKAGSKFVLKFPSDETISCGVSRIKYLIIDLCFCLPVILHIADEHILQNYTFKLKLTLNCSCHWHLNT